MQWPGVASVQASAGGGAVQHSAVLLWSRDWCWCNAGAGAVQHCCPDVLCCVKELHLIAGGVWVKYSEVLLQLSDGAMKCLCSNEVFGQ